MLNLPHKANQYTLSQAATEQKSAIIYYIYIYIYTKIIYCMPSEG